MELIATRGPHQPETIGGILVDGQVVGGIQIPDLASILAGFNPDTNIAGLDWIPVDQQPPTTIVHLSWDAMVGIGTALVLLGVWALVLGAAGATTRRLAGSCERVDRRIRRVIALEAAGSSPRWDASHGSCTDPRTADAVTRAPASRRRLSRSSACMPSWASRRLIALRTLRRWAAHDAAAGGRAYATRRTRPRPTDLDGSAGTPS